MTCAARRSAVGLLARSAMIASLALLMTCPQAGAQTIGYLYSALHGNVAQFDVSADTSLTYEGVVAGGATTVNFPGSLVMAKTADSENLYQLAGTSTTETIYQYSVSPSGALSAKSPAAVGSIPLLASQEQRFMAVFNPAASGMSGQNALYVLAGPDTKSADIYIFDIDATTGALTPAGVVAIPGMIFGEALAYSGNVLAVTGSASEGEGFQRAVIEPSTGTPEFEALPDAPCLGHSCDDGPLYMLDSEHMLSSNLIFNPNKIEEYVPGFSAYEVGGSWGELGSSAAYRYGDAGITANSHEYLVVVRQVEFEHAGQEEEYTGETDLQAIAADGGSEGVTPLAAESSKSFGPLGIFSLGSGLYIANGETASGVAYRLSSSQTPVSTELDSPLGAAMTGFLIGGAGTEGPGPVGPNPSPKTPPAGASGTETSGAPVKGSALKAISLSTDASAKLKSGIIKLDVDCGLPCTVTGVLLPPGAKAASAHKPRALPFKSVKLPGSGKPAAVTLRFTSAQKKLATVLLRKHKKVTARITVTEAPGGAAARSKSIRVVT